MNQDLAQIVTFYSTKPHNELNSLLLSKSKDNLISMLTDLLTAYINDRNSSSLREFVTVSIAGYQHHDAKLGYNSFKQSTGIGGKPIACEAKPKNIYKDRYDEKRNEPKLEEEYFREILLPFENFCRTFESFTKIKVSVWQKKYQYLIQMQNKSVLNTCKRQVIPM